MQSLDDGDNNQCYNDLDDEDGKDDNEVEIKDDVKNDIDRKDYVIHFRCCQMRHISKN